jgi:hypothetical protein
MGAIGAMQSWAAGGQTLQGPVAQSPFWLHAPPAPEELVLLDVLGELDEALPPAVPLAPAVLLAPAVPLAPVVVPPGSRATVPTQADTAVSASMAPGAMSFRIQNLMPSPRRRDLQV